MIFVWRSAGLRVTRWRPHDEGQDPESLGRGSDYAGTGNPGKVRGEPGRGEGGPAGRADLIGVVGL